MSDKQITTTRKIGKITYQVAASPSDKATDTLKTKLEKLIIKDLRKTPGKSGLSAKN